MATGRIGVTPTLGTRWSKAPAGGTTSLSGLDDNSVSLVYSVGYEQVYRNGVLLSRGNDYTATTGNSITLIDATIAGDIIEVFANELVPLTDAISKGQFTAKGALLSATAASTPAVLTVGSNNQVLTADSSTATGLKWATADALPSQTGNSGKYLTTNGTTASWGTPVTTWTQRITQSTGRFNTIAYNGSNLYVAAGQSGVLYTSSDGITWTSRTSGFGANDILKVVFANSIWVAVGYQGVITTSTDGITWTARTANMGTNNIYDVIYENSTWVAVGDGGGSTNTGGLTYSTDAITWTRKSQTLTVGAVYKSIVWNGTNYIIGANNSTNNILTASTASGTWTARASGSGAAINYIAWDGTRHYYVTNTGASARWWYSTTTTMTSSSDLTIRAKQVSDSQHYFYSGGRIYGLGCFVQNFKMESGLPSSQGDIGLSPTNELNASGLNDDSAAIWFGTAGYIVGDQRGRLWTSF